MKKKIILAVATFVAGIGMLIVGYMGSLSDGTEVIFISADNGSNTQAIKIFSIVLYAGIGLIILSLILFAVAGNTGGIER